MTQTVIVAILTFIASAPFWGLIAALVDRLRFDGISADFLPGTVGAIGVYADAVGGLGVRLKVTNVTSRPLAIERIDALLSMKPKRGAPSVHLASGTFLVSMIEDGPYGAEVSMEGYPIVVPGGGGQVYLQLSQDTGMQYFRRERRFFFFPRFIRLTDLGVDDPQAPADPEGNRMYFEYFDLTSLELHLRVNGKVRKLPVSIWKLKEAA